MEEIKNKLQKEEKRVMEFREKVDLLKSVVDLANETAKEKDIETEEMKLELFLEAREKLFTEAISDISKKSLNDSELEEIIANLSLFLYLEDATADIGYKLFVKKSLHVGELSLFKTWRMWASNFLSWNYFDSTLEGLISEYMDVEHQLVALSEVSGVESIEFQDIIKKYSKEIVERLS